MSVGKAPPCVPTWRGHVETTKDALLIFEGCFNGTLAHCFRRPHDRERASLIVSGNVFVYEEATSGIKRWTDGIPWSPSRILTNFLIYRQLNSPFPPGEKKRATKRSQRVHKSGDPYPSSATGAIIKDEHSTSFSPESPGLRSDGGTDKDGDRTLVGSLIDSYEFKKDGLLKKTMTVTIKGVSHHLVSYYNLDDAKHNLKTPREDRVLKDLVLRPDLIHQTKFKFPNLDDAGDGVFEQADTSQYGLSYPNGYNPARSYPTPSPGQSPYIDASMQYYYAQPYWNQPHAANGVPYGAVSTNPTAYAPAAPPIPAYPLNQSHSASSQYAWQGSRNHSHQQLQQQQPSHGVPHHQANLASPRGQQMHTGGQPYPSSTTLPRPNAGYDAGHASHESSGVHHGVIDTYSTGSAPTGMYQGIAQMPAGYVSVTQQYAPRSDGSSQSYRAYS
ncbi:MAG: hypothetical protein LQ350_005781 [Teloschistes chrysophthalmus]|nr:MAG: hypothetical protein LQ350_005781 [Niorma chrysophthalma]